MNRKTSSPPGIHNPILLWLLFPLIAIFLGSCQLEPAGWQPGSDPEWVYTDLRVLDPPDAAIPEEDILAGYLRQLGAELQIRLDFLDLDVVPDTDIYLALDSVPGGATELPWHAPAGLSWDTLLVIPAAGEIQLLVPDLHPLSGSSLRVIRDPIQDSLTISLLASSLPGQGLPIAVKAWSTPAGSTAVSDELAAFRSDGSPPAPVPVLLAFWDTLPAYTPALGLRRWDGAHTGPLGGRHGLYNLLRTARARQIPLVLLDLKTSTSLSALDYVDGVSMVREMAARGELVLPDVQPGFIPDEAGGSTNWLQETGWSLPGLLARNDSIATKFGFAPSLFRYSPAGLSPELAGSSRMIFTFNPRLTRPRRTRWRQQVVLELPLALPQAAPTINGPDLDMRHQLVDGALVSAEQPGTGLVVLGGDLPASAWGNPEIARATFSYLVSHPWIQLLSGYDVLGLPFPTNPADSHISESPALAPGWIEELIQAPKNALGEAAWQAYTSLYAPVYPHPAELPGLREAYLGSVKVLLTAANWIEAPTPVQDCAQDIDLDGIPECLLGSERLLAVIQPETGELTFLFAIGEDGPHQLIGPGYQLITGLSEPETWGLGESFNSDPGVSSGGFRDPDQPGAPAPAYSLQEVRDGLLFQSVDGAVRKSYRLAEDQLAVVLETSRPTSYELPLSVDPWLRFTPDWSKLYTARPISRGWWWGVENGPGVAIRSETPVQFDSVLDSLDAIGQPEDPNQDHPGGHWLPFPTARLTIQVQNQARLTISLEEAGKTQ